ncbi:MAG: hypothetical protein OCC49_12015 [Fibrobacterales bacterium]
MKIIQLFIVSTFLISGFIGCEITVTETAPAVGYIKFVNQVEKELEVGGTVQYSMKNIEVQEQKWNETITYGNTSSIKEVTPHSGTLTVYGEVNIPKLNNNWEEVSWDIDQNVTAGDTITIFLTGDDE